VGVRGRGKAVGRVGVRRGGGGDGGRPGAGDGLARLGRLGADLLAGHHERHLDELAVVAHTGLRFPVLLLLFFLLLFFLLLFFFLIFLLLFVVFLSDSTIVFIVFFVTVLNTTLAVTFTFLLSFPFLPLR
jgi:hypothetical protein